MPFVPDNLENYVKLRRISPEPARPGEIDVFLKNAEDALCLLARADNAQQRFFCAYPAAHAFAVAALRLQGYRPHDRAVAFQCLTHTTNTSDGDVQNFVAAHSARNQNTYEGVTLNWSSDIYADLDAAVTVYCEATRRLGKEVAGMAAKARPAPSSAPPTPGEEPIPT